MGEPSTRNATANIPIDLRFWIHVDIRDADECWVWRGRVTHEGYGVMCYRDANVRAHRLALELTTTPVPPGMVVCHRCDNPPCVNPAHLFVGTHQDNMRDMKAKGRAAVGERHSRARIGAKEVAEIRKRAAAGEADSLLGAAFGISRKTVFDVVARRSWRHLP